MTTLLSSVSPGAVGSTVSVSLARDALGDPLGIVGACLRQVDCTRRGWRSAHIVYEIFIFIYCRYDIYDFIIILTHIKYNIIE